MAVTEAGGRQGGLPGSLPRPPVGRLHLPCPGAAPRSAPNMPRPNSFAAGHLGDAGHESLAPHEQRVLRAHPLVRTAGNPQRHAMHEVAASDGGK